MLMNGGQKSFCFRPLRVPGAPGARAGPGRLRGRRPWASGGGGVIGGSVWRRRCGRVAARSPAARSPAARSVPGVVPPSAVLGAAAVPVGPRGRILGRDLRRARGRRGTAALFTKARRLRATR